MHVMPLGPIKKQHKKESKHVITLENGWQPGIRASRDMMTSQRALKNVSRQVYSQEKDHRIVT